jgi:hypothetical protein
MDGSAICEFAMAVIRPSTLVLYIGQGALAVKIQVTTIASLAKIFLAINRRGILLIVILREPEGSVDVGARDHRRVQAG